MKSNLDRRKCIHGIHRHISDMNVGTVADCTDTRGGWRDISKYVALEVRLIETTVKASHPHCYIDQ